MRLLDVPFVSQQRALCGGAAVSMVMRFWGESDARASDFASLVTPDGAGIRAQELERFVHDRGWNAWPLTDGIDGAAKCLTQGRPIVALIDENGSTDHYVVVVAITEDRVCVHDPARGPFQLLDRGRFERAWRAAGEWALLILPPATPRAAAADPVQTPRYADGVAVVAIVSACDSLVDRAVATAQAGDLATAEALLRRAHVYCPDSAEPLCELAGVRFLQERWSEAESLAASATRLHASGGHAWQLLAASRYMRGDDEAALAAWNAIDEPRIDLTRIDGLGRTRYDVVSRYLGLRDGRVLTEGTLRRARRRLDALPSQAAARMSYAPLPDGLVRIDVNVLEKPRWSLGVRALPLAGVHAIVAREASLEGASGLGLGEVWAASWRWWENRPRVALGVTLPGNGVVWSARAAWERQDVRLGDATTRFEHRTTSLEIGQWLRADLGWEAGVSLSRWSDREFDVSVQGALETRHAADRVALRANGSHAWRARGGGVYSIAGIGAGWRSTADSDPNHVRVTARAGFAGASEDAPMMLWPAAGSEPGCAVALRAHPLFDHGVVDGKGWGRTIAHGGLEGQSPPVRMQLASFRLAAFLDVAKPWLPGSSRALPVQMDVGVGLRMQLVAHRECVRIDVAHGTRDGQNAISIGIERAGSFR